MKVAGRIIQNRNIIRNTESKFFARYKQHNIDIVRLESESDGNPLFNVDVFHISGSTAVDGVIQRCCIRDALIWALEQALL